MKTQAIQKQNFNGNVYFVEKAGEKSAKPLKEYFVQKVGKSAIEQINSLIKEKPYDLFITRSEIHPGFYNVEADTSFVEAVKNRPEKGNIGWFSDGSIKWFPHSIKYVMENYENFAARTQAQAEKISKNYVLKPYKKN